MKDNFSKQSKLYSQFRPGYPKELYDFLLPLVPEKKAAWDCGTGNGQVAGELANHFEKVFATDISENQIKNAVRKNNIFYKVESTENTSFEDNQFDLITIAQAIHWFDFDRFYREVNRTLKPNGIIAAIGYQIMSIDDETDKIIRDFYENTTGPYWDKERRYIDENYLTIPFPFKEIETPKLHSVYEWNIDQLIGFLNTWSAVQHYITKNKSNPVDTIIGELKKCWRSNPTKTVVFPILLRVGSKQ